MKQPEPTKTQEAQSTEIPPSQTTETTDMIVPTEEEWEGYYFVKAILHDSVEPSKIVNILSISFVFVFNLLYVLPSVEIAAE